MGDWIVFLVWLGGIAPAYRINRGHSNAVGSAFDALIWPMGLAQSLIRRLYESPDA